MRSWLACSASACALATAGDARADDCTTEQQATATSTCVVMSRSGQPGAWLALPRLDEVTRAYALAPQLAAQLARYGELTRALTIESDAWEHAAEERKQQALDALSVASKATVVAEHVAQQLDEERAAASSAWHSPYLWLGVGVVLGGGAVTALAIAVR
jgi:hypothetical protein